MLLTLLQAAAPVPPSGYVLCFFPLAAVILGFILAARLTDRQATATYRRVPPSDDVPAHE
ncbi:MAG TPA: hypothetical protein PKA05_20685 [Roseiflexaceae bacterium]|nr:hypothetical protein [Roseiflexaceae bacterium]HMP42808.1 hypothetical protein [Roseiflexaceae bacterium]